MFHRHELTSLELPELVPYRTLGQQRGHREQGFFVAEGGKVVERVLERNCAACGAQALIVGETCASPWLRRAVRTSMGTILKLPAVEPPNLAHTLRELRAAGVRCVAAHPHTEQRTLARANLTGDCCLVFGSEGHGLSPAVLAECDEAVAVPMANGVDSLNVGSAAAVFLYEVARQRGRM